MFPKAFGIFGCQKVVSLLKKQPFFQMLQSQHPNRDGNLELEKFSCFPKHLAFLAVKKCFFCSKSILLAQMLQSQHPKRDGNLEFEKFSCFPKHLTFLAIRKWFLLLKKLPFSTNVAIQTSQMCWKSRIGKSFGVFPKCLAFLPIRKWFLCSRNSYFLQMLQSQHPKRDGNLEFEKFSCFPKHLAFRVSQKTAF